MDACGSAKHFDIWKGSNPGGEHCALFRILNQACARVQLATEGRGPEPNKPLDREWLFPVQDPAPFRDHEMRYVLRADVAQRVCQFPLEGGRHLSYRCLW